MYVAKITIKLLLSPAAPLMGLDAARVAVALQMNGGRSGPAPDGLLQPQTELLVHCRVPYARRWQQPAAGRERRRRPRLALLMLPMVS